MAHCVLPAVDQVNADDQLNRRCSPASSSKIVAARCVWCWYYGSFLICPDSRTKNGGAPNGWRLSCERLLAGRKEPCSVQRRSTAQRTNERFPPAALGSFKRWLGGAASHAAVDQPDRPRNARRGPPDLRKPAQALGLRQSARGVGPRARAAGTRRAGCGRRRCGGRSCRARRRDSRRRCVPRRWHR